MTIYGDRVAQPRLDVSSSPCLFIPTAISAASITRFKSAYKKGLARFASMNALKAFNPTTCIPSFKDEIEVSKFISN